MYQNHSMQAIPYNAPVPQQRPAEPLYSMQVVHTTMPGYALLFTLMPWTVPPGMQFAQSFILGFCDDEGHDFFALTMVHGDINHRVIYPDRPGRTLPFVTYRSIPWYLANANADSESDVPLFDLRKIRSMKRIFRICYDLVACVTYNMNSSLIIAELARRLSQPCPEYHLDFSEALFTTRNAEEILAAIQRYNREVPRRDPYVQH